VIARSQEHISSLKRIKSIEIENFRQLIASYMYTLQVSMQIHIHRYIHTVHTYIRNDLCHGDAEGFRLTLVDGDVERLLTVSPQPLRDDGVKLRQSFKPFHTYIININTSISYLYLCSHACM
jgi:hypothetical protein